jgi:hypothetical protein
MMMVSYCGTFGWSEAVWIEGCGISDVIGFDCDVLSTCGANGSDTWVGTSVIGRLFKAWRQTKVGIRGWTACHDTFPQRTCQLGKKPESDQLPVLRTKQETANAKLRPMHLPQGQCFPPLILESAMLFRLQRL